MDYAVRYLRLMRKILYPFTSSDELLYAIYVVGLYVLYSNFLVFLEYYVLEFLPVDSSILVLVCILNHLPDFSFRVSLTH